jgi:hypothetical protein
MPLTWVPDPATVPWHDVQADEIWVEGPITAADAEALLTVTGYSCEVVGPEPLNGLHILADAAGVTASAPNTLVDAFPPVDIEYQIKGVTGHCRYFADLPAEADEVIRYTPHPVNEKTWTLRVTAHCLDAASGDSEDVSEEFKLRVRANYSPGRDALKEAIDARRH